MKSNFTTAALGLLALAVPAYAQQRDPSVSGQRATEQEQQRQQGQTQQQQQQQQRAQQQAAQQQQQQRQQAQQQQSGAESWLASSKINGAEVKNQAQESVGTISELIVDPNSSRIVFAVVETRNFLGLNQKKYLIPWQTFRVDRNLEEPDQVGLILDTTREKLEKSFEFEEDKMSSIRPEEVYSYWGQDFRQSQQQQGQEGQRQQPQSQPQGGQQPDTSRTSPMREREGGATTPGRPGTGTPGTTTPGGSSTNPGGGGTGSGSGSPGGSGTSGGGTGGGGR